MLNTNPVSHYAKHEHCIALCWTQTLYRAILNTNPVSRYAVPVLCCAVQHRERGLRAANQSPEHFQPIRISQIILCTRKAWRVAVVSGPLWNERWGCTIPLVEFMYLVCVRTHACTHTHTRARTHTHTSVIAHVHILRYMHKIRADQNWFSLVQARQS